MAWLDSEIQVMERYHNHKETMAWGATGLYAPVVIILSTKAGPILNPWPKIIFSVIVAFLALAALMFLNMQFRKRWEAADVITALRRTRASLSDSETFPGGFITAILPIPAQWPDFIQEEIDAVRTSSQKEIGLLSFFFALMLPWKWKTIDDRWKTEIITYIVVDIATVIALFSLWWKEVQILL